MRQIVWARSALDDFEAAIAYIAKDNPQAAQTIAKRLMNSVEKLADIPVGRIGRVSGTYEKHVPKTPYILAYSLTENTLAIVRVIHERRDWRLEEWPEP